jgi:hypothetical protein
MTKFFVKVICCAALLLFFLRSSPARDLGGKFDNSPLKQWFDSLASRKGACCSFADGVSIADVDWDTKDENYRVRLDGQWIEVPPEARPCNVSMSPLTSTTMASHQPFAGPSLAMTKWPMSLSSQSPGSPGDPAIAIIRSGTSAFGGYRRRQSGVNIGCRMIPFQLFGWNDKTGANGNMRTL